MSCTIMESYNASFLKPRGSKDADKRFALMNKMIAGVASMEAGSCRISNSSTASIKASCGRQAADGSLRT